MSNGIVERKMEAVKSIFSYKNYGPLSPALPGFSVLLPTRSMRLIRLVIALLYPRDQIIPIRA
jgi:hypothetical protein